MPLQGERRAISAEALTPENFVKCTFADFPSWLTLYKYIAKITAFYTVKVETVILELQCLHYSQRKIKWELAPKIESIKLKFIEWVLKWCFSLSSWIIWVYFMFLRASSMVYVFCQSRICHAPQRVKSFWVELFHLEKEWKRDTVISLLSQYLY